MTIQYKNQGFNLTTSNLTTVLNISLTAVAIVKSVSVANTSSGAVEVTFKIRDRSATTDFNFFTQSLGAKTTQQVAGQVLNLEAGDAIKAQAASANTLQGVISYALLDRSQENG